jgi:hypothetical protein
MRPEKQVRRRQLPKLIAKQDDADALKNLALELQKGNPLSQREDID